MARPELEVTSSRIVYENRWMRLREDRTILPDGSAGLYAVVEKAPSALIIPLEDEHLWLVEQYRHPARARFWELPQGAWDDCSDPDGEALARGELAEETGLRAGRLERLGRLYFAYGVLDQTFEVWLATDLRQGEQALESTEQGLRVGRFAIAEVEDMVVDGRIADNATVAALGLLALRRRRGHPDLGSPETASR
jgi:8-oxo-dGTP pyrophosphatase MutT (NUDIX family)